MSSPILEVAEGPLSTATLGIPQPTDTPPVRTLQAAQGARPSLHPRLAGASEDHSLARREASVSPGQAGVPLGQAASLCPVLLSLPVTGHHLPSLLGPSFCSLTFSGFGSPGWGQGGGRRRLPERSHVAPSIPRVLTGKDPASLCGESGCAAAGLLEKARLAHTRSRRLGPSSVLLHTRALPSALPSRGGHWNMRLLVSNWPSGSSSSSSASFCLAAFWFCQRQKRINLSSLLHLWVLIGEVELAVHLQAEEPGPLFPLTPCWGRCVWKRSALVHLASHLAPQAVRDAR